MVLKNLTVGKPPTFGMSGRKVANPGCVIAKVRVCFVGWAVSEIWQAPIWSRNLKFWRQLVKTSLKLSIRKLVVTLLHRPSNVCTFWLSDVFQSVFMNINEVMNINDASWILISDQHYSEAGENPDSPAFIKSKLSKNLIHTMTDHLALQCIMAQQCHLSYNLTIFTSSVNNVGQIATLTKLSTVVVSSSCVAFCAFFKVFKTSTLHLHQLL